MASQECSIVIISGGVGASGEQLVNTVLAQFPDEQVQVTTIGNVRHPKQIDIAIRQAAAVPGGIIVHTLIDPQLRSQLIRMADEKRVPAVDLMGPLLTHLIDVLGQEPINRPGQYRQLRKQYFERVAAIDFAMAHDDGKNSQDWGQAEIILTGVSRVGKTPLSMYLSVLGWKVANLPLVSGIAPPAELFQLDPGRVIGLTIEPGQLLSHRQRRQQRLGAGSKSPYSNPAAVYEEVEAARRLFRQSGFSTINVTDKAIEASAEDIIALITRRYGASDAESPSH